jgi:hypothetical protein
LIEDIELVKSLNVFAQRAFPSGVLTLLVDFGSVARDFRKNEIQEFGPEILPIDSSTSH